MAEWCRKCQVDIWAWCLMPNHAHLEGQDDQLVKVAPLLEMVGDWRIFLDSDEEIDKDRLRQHERTGRPLGRESFVEGLEMDLNRILRPRKTGPKK
jgi:putative transposase